MTLINPTIRNKLRPGPNPIAIAKLIVALNQKPLCRTDVMEQIGITAATATRWLNLLKNENLIYVVYWRYTGGQPVAYWMFGYMVDSEPRPKPKTGAQMSKEWRARKMLARAEEKIKTEMKNRSKPKRSGPV